MKRFYPSKFLSLAALLLGFGAASNAQTLTFSLTGGMQSYSVPAGVSSLDIDMAGAGGGGTGNCCSTTQYNNGGRVQCQLSVTPGQIYYIYVGGAGSFGNYSYPNLGGYNGGGNGYGYGGGGGGGTDISTNTGASPSARTRIIVAGGGGGQGSGYCNSEYGGNGGGLSGGDGMACSNSTGYLCYTGRGGTQTGGGASGTCTSWGGQGSLGLGGTAYSGSYYAAAGGGGGYYGGGGAYYYGGGGGGSSFPAANGGNITGLIHTQGYNTAGNGYCKITPLFSQLFSAPTSLNFGTVLVGTTAVPQVAVISGLRLTGFPGTLTATSSSSGYEISTDGITWGSTANIPFSASILSGYNLYVRFKPMFTITYSANVTITGGGQPTPLVIPLTGIGANACSSLPTGGTATSSVTSANTSTTFNLGLTGASVGGGMQYQWQVSTDGGATWNDVVGAVLPISPILGISTTSVFRCKVTCPGSGSVFSTNVTVSYVSLALAATSCTTPQSANNPGGLSPNYGFYVGSPGNPFRLIGDLGTQILDNTSPTGTCYMDQTALYNVQLSPGGSYTATNNISPWNGLSFQVWIDFNQNGVFDATESVGGVVANTGSTMPPMPINIPSTCPYGTFRMRVVVNFNGGGSCNSNYPCYPNQVPCFTTTVQYAEARDYTVIIAQPKCTGTPNPGISFASQNVGCGPYSVNLFEIGATTGVDGLSYIWQSSTDSIVWTDIAGASTQTYTKNATSTLFYRAKATCSYSASSAATFGQKVTVNVQPVAISGPSSFCSVNSVTMSDATPGGSWVSSNPAVATINSSGVVTGVSGGTTTISYQMPTGCYVSKVLTVNLSPSAISGSTTLCTSATTSLSNTVAGGVWSSSNPTIASINPGSGLVTGVAAGALYFTYTIPVGGCYSTYTMTVNTQPAAITGGTDVCVGSSMTLSDASVGGTWTSSSVFQASISSTGVVTGIVTSNPTMSYTLPGGCYSTKVITVDPLPLPISGTGGICVGQMFNFATGSSGGVWSSSNPSVASVNTSGDVTGVAAGSANIIYTFPTTGCATSLATAINPLPAVFNVTGGGGYCAGSAGAHVNLSGSTVGINYNLYNTGSYVATLGGSSAALDYGAMSAVGTYSVQAVDATTGCTSDMNGSTTVSINPLPLVQILSAPSGNAYCVGLPGKPLSLMGSETGVTYQLWNSAGVPVGTPVNGTGSGISMGVQPAETYYVIATNTGTLCAETMSGTQTITANYPPTVYPVNSSGTSYCAGGAGIDVYLPSSDNGIQYMLYKNGSTLVKTMTSGGGLLDFGNQTAAGSYTVVALDIAGCSSNMAGTITIVVNPLPTNQTLTGGGAFCAGDPGKHIGLLNSVAGTNYELFKVGSGTTGIVVGGSNTSIDFGLITSAGAYQVVATNSFGCNATMSGTANVIVNPVPNAQTVTGGGAYCAGDAGKHVGLLNSEPTVKYQLYRDGIIVGAPKPGTNTNLDFGTFTVPGYYTVVGTNNVTGCTNMMPGGVNISINPLPIVYTVSGGGAYCFGDPGSEVFISGTESGLEYVMSVNGTPIVPSYSGTGGAGSLGFQTAPGTYTVLAKNNTTGCTKAMAGSASVVVNPLPVNYKVTGAGSYCDGAAGLLIGDSLSATGVDYTLLQNGVPVGSVLGGTGAKLKFGTFPAGTYTIKAVNTSTGCTNVTATGDEAVVVMNTLPAQYTVTGGGTFCVGDTGRHVFLSSSDMGVSYNLYNGSSFVMSMIGTTSGLDFGALTAGGNYTVKAVDNATTCASNMMATAILTANPAPNAYSISQDATSRCSFGPAIKMNLSNSELGTKYQVYNNGVAEGTYFAGTGLPIFLGTHTNSGTYKVIATNLSTGCSAGMVDSAMITIRPTNVPAVSLPTGDTICEGSTPVLSASYTKPGTHPTYLWKVNGLTAGSGATLSGVSFNDGDIVSVTLTSDEDCASPAMVKSNDMTMTVTPSSLPTASVTVTPSNFICPGASVTFSVKDTYGKSKDGSIAPSYQWIQNGVPVGTGTSYTVKPTDSVTVFCTMVSAYECRTTSYVLSNNVTVAINEPILPLFMISEITSTHVNKGEPVTLKAVVSNKGSFTYQWYVHGQAIDGATNPTFTYNYTNDQEVVKCVVTSHGNCGTLAATQTTLISVRDNTGVKSVGVMSDVKLIPNPNKGTFTVKGSTGTTVDEEVSMEITNMLGQTVYTNKVMTQNGNINAQVQLNGTLANGMYLLTLRSTNGTEVFHFVLEQ